MNPDNIRIVLVNTSHPGNIGGVARAMKNMGLHRLYLVAPRDYPNEQAVWRAASASDVLDTATVVISRLRNGFSIMRGGSDHLSHRLVRQGLSDRLAVIVLTAVAAVSGVIAVAEPVLSTPTWLLTVGVLWAGLISLGIALLRVPVYQE